VPVPVSEEFTVSCGFESLTLSVPATAPVALGLNVTFNVHEAFARSEVRQEVFCTI